MKLVGVMVVEDPGEAEKSSDPVPAVAEVANRPIVHHVLDALERVGVHEVVVASSPCSARTVRACLAARDGGRARLSYVEAPYPLRLPSALGLASPLVRDSACIVHAAGGLLAEPLSPLVDCIGEGPDAVLMVHQAPAPDERLTPAAQSMLHLAELDPARSSFGVAGVWAFGPGAMRRASVAPAISCDGVIQVAERITAGGGTVQVRLAETWRAYRGESSDLLELNRIALDRLDVGPHRFHAEDTHIEGRVWIHKSARVRASVIVGPTVIGPGAAVADAYIGPYTSIGAGSRVEGAEIERSIIGEGASVVHVGSRLVASVVGRGARVFRDFSLPRALRLRIGEGSEIALC